MENTTMFGGSLWIWVIFIGFTVISWLISHQLKSRFQKYSKIPTANGMTGRDVVEKMLRDNGVTGVKIGSVEGMLTDHYNPSKKTLNLSDSVYGSNSVAAIGVAAHECGHAVQHQQGYAPLKIRGAMVPAVNLGSNLSWLFILGGVILGMNQTLLNVGILLFSLAVIFQLVTLPVEFNASSRALRILGSTGIMYEDEVGPTRKVLSAAALTYVAGAASALLSLLRLVILFGGRDND